MRRALCEQLLKKLDQEGRIEERTQARLQEIKEEIQRIDTALRAYYDEM